MKHLEETIKEKVPTLVVFVHEGKEEAEDVKPAVEELRAKYNGKANIVYFPNHFNNRISEHYRITAYPCYILFKEGEELMRESGHKTVTELSELVERAL
ncbi:MAG: thioredoxin family protein [Muribaculaceae bacterium]|nr:thioredoxin family protein [Muribaculaceae bacterium]